MNTVTLKFIDVDLPLIMRLPGSCPSTYLSTDLELVGGSGKTPTLSECGVDPKEVDVG